MAILHMHSRDDNSFLSKAVESQLDVGVILSRIKCSEIINFMTIYCSSAQKREQEDI
jgi:hypothetical protein